MGRRLWVIEKKRIRLEMDEKRTKRLIDELDTIWEVLMKNEVVAIEAVSTAQKTHAKLRNVEQRLLRIEEENADLREHLSKHDV